MPGNALFLHRILKATEWFHKAGLVSQGRAHHPNPDIYMPLGSHWAWCLMKKKNHVVLNESSEIYFWLFFSPMYQLYKKQHLNLAPPPNQLGNNQNTYLKF